MTRLVLTEEELQNAPVIETLPDIKTPQTRSRLNLVLCIVLGINAFFQLIAMFTPGWLVVTNEVASSYVSVYYRVQCVKTDLLGEREGDDEKVCSSKTLLQIFQDSYDSSSGTSRAATVLSYNLQVRYQLNIQFSWFIAVGATIFQFIRYIKADRAYPRLLVVNLMAMTCACSAMYQVLFEAFAYIDFTLRSTDDSKSDVGFSYSVFFYALAFVQTCASTLVIVKQLFDYVRSLRTSISESKVKFDTIERKYEADKEWFRNYQDSHRQHHLRPRSRASYTDDKPVSGNHSARNSPRPSPRPSPRSSPRSSPRPSDKSNARYKELLERSRDKHRDLDDSLQDRFLFPDEQSHRPHGHSSGQRGHSPRPDDHSPKPRGHSPRPRNHSPKPLNQFPSPLDQIPRPNKHFSRPHDYENAQYLGPREEHKNSDTEESSTSDDQLLNSNGHPEVKSDISKEKDALVKKEDQEHVGPESIELKDCTVHGQSQFTSAADV